MEIKTIGEIGNYYSRLNVTEHDGKFYWCIENYNTDFKDLNDWDEIDKELYDALIASEERRKNTETKN